MGREGKKNEKERGDEVARPRLEFAGRIGFGSRGAEELSDSPGHLFLFFFGLDYLFFFPF